MWINSFFCVIPCDFCVEKLRMFHSLKGDNSFILSGLIPQGKSEISTTLNLKIFWHKWSGRLSPWIIIRSRIPVWSTSWNIHIAVFYTSTNGTLKFIRNFDYFVNFIYLNLGRKSANTLNDFSNQLISIRSGDQFKF